METNRTEKIAEGIYWVGGHEHNGGLHCNPYLIIDEEEAVLIDPGSVLDFEYVYENVCSLVPLEKIKYVILHHQDPDFCASVPLFEKKGASFKIVTHWRTQTLVKYYGVKSDYYIVNKNDFKLMLKSGRILGFIQTPYLHFPGAITTYDYQTKTLFSSDLFGAFSYEWKLYASEGYMEKMKAFHEHYMPSNDILRPVMEVFLSMDISMIAPQHGSILNNHIRDYIKALRDLECGTFMTTIRRNLVQSGGYSFVCSLVLKRFVSIFNREEVLEAVEQLDITLNKDTMEIVDYNYRGSVFWDLMFEQILIQKGVQWLIVIEPLVQRLSKEYDIPVPEVYKNTLMKAQEEAAFLSSENTMLKEINDRLHNSVREAQDKLTKCPVTGLYNTEFFKNYLNDNIGTLIAEGSQQNPALVLLSVDNMSKIKFSYGDDEADETLKNIVYTINSLREENTVPFMLRGESLACYIPHTTKTKAVEFAENLRNAIQGSGKFIEKITVSLGVVCLDEIREMTADEGKIAEMLYSTAMMRVKLAKSMGMNIVCSKSLVESYQDDVGKIMIADTDEVNLDVLKTFLENLQYRVFAVKDGEEAIETCERENPDLIISEVMLPKFDGFVVREKLLAQSLTKNVPFIVVSHLKNDDSVQRASALKIEHYFKKPYMLSELLGVIRNKIKGDVYQ
ncbi:MAG: response regulator [Thermoclostridium sp.]|nr:response regulator [Thermoclostridium sp.]